MLAIGAVEKDAVIFAHVREVPETKAVLLLGREKLVEAAARAVLASATAATETQRNDKFSKYRAAVMAPEHNVVEVLQICPATPSDIKKYSQQRRAVFRETPALYTAVTLPWVTALPPDETAWVRNLVTQQPRAAPPPPPSSSSVRETVLHEDDDFVLVTDTKWQGSDPAAMYVLGIVRAHHAARLRSVRDLRGPADAALLRRIAARAEQAIAAAYGVKRTEYCAFLHYVPSFWHLHVHFVALASAASRDGNAVVGRAMLLDDVADALDADPDHFAKVTLSVVLPSNHPLYNLIGKKAGANQ
jgi:m7GpppX diphosphatase